MPLARTLAIGPRLFVRPAKVVVAESVSAGPASASVIVGGVRIACAPPPPPQETKSAAHGRIAADFIVRVRALIGGTPAVFGFILRRGNGHGRGSPAGPPLGSGLPSRAMPAPDRGRHERLEGLFAAARELPAGERAAFVAAQCGGDESLRTELMELLDLSHGAGAFLEQAADPWVGRRIDRWRIGKRLGSGGMGVVYLAVRDDGAFQQEAALKLRSEEHT